MQKLYAILATVAMFCTMGVASADPMEDLFHAEPDPMENIFQVPQATCGSSNGGSFTSAPNTNLCNIGNPSAVTGGGPWNWTCTYVDPTNPSTANCSASVAGGGGGGGGTTGGGGGGGGGGSRAIIYQCDDGIDNDGNGLIDFPDDPNCSSLTDNNEGPDSTGGGSTGGGGGGGIRITECNDGIDNDGNGKTDFGFDPGCSSPYDDDESGYVYIPQCRDGIDNDGNGKTDFGFDSGCDSPDDDLEAGGQSATSSGIKPQDNGNKPKPVQKLPSTGAPLAMLALTGAGVGAFLNSKRKK